MLKLQLSRKNFLSLAAAGAAAGVLDVACGSPAAQKSDGTSGGSGSTAGGSNSVGGTSGGSATTGGSAGSVSSGGSTGGSNATSGGSGGSSGGSGGTSGGTDASGGANGGEMCSADVTVTSSGESHTHDLTVSMAAITAGVTVEIETTDSNDHTHWVELTDADLATLQSGGSVTKRTCNAFTDHEFVISCVDTPAAGPPACEEADMCGSEMGNTCPD
jgi:hypothetical protein